MTNLYLVVSSIVFPILALCWLCCIACCIYRSLFKSFSKAPTSTKVEVIDGSRRKSGGSDASTGSQTRSFRTGPLSETSTPGTMPMVDDDLRSPYGPVMVVPENFKNSVRGKSLSDSFGPSYYPKYPQSSSGDTPTHSKASPMNPLQAPWPHLPPLPKKKTGDRRMPTSIRSFLENQP